MCLPGCFIERHISSEIEYTCEKKRIAFGGANREANPVFQELTFPRAAKMMMYHIVFFAL